MNNQSFNTFLTGNTTIMRFDTTLIRKQKKFVLIYQLGRQVGRLYNIHLQACVLNTRFTRRLISPCQIEGTIHREERWTTQTRLVIQNNGQVTRLTPELAPNGTQSIQFSSLMHKFRFLLMEKVKYYHFVPTL